MIKYLTVDYVIYLHDIIREHFPENTASGKINKNKIQSIVDKPSLKIADQEIYTTIYEKAACLLEAFCREHVFTDGNKRTAILAMFTFLTINNHNIVLPSNTVKYIVEITKHMEQKPEDIKILIKEISKWIEKRSSINNKNRYDI
ncbi:MAG: death-on-curing family protein [Cenarchaeum symbiont of Oopsacas minuta]|nr:death-on-curing family protein [Cenarchaeum symbiont of Oopsacas minuta]